MTYALVLGGGGPVGISWETGLLAGMRGAGVDLSKADLIVGTSAGSIVGAQIATGCDLDQLYAQQLQPSPELMAMPVADLAPLTQAFFAANAAGETLQQTRVRIGAGAIHAVTASEADWLHAIASRLPSHHWPEQLLRITAIDALDGAFTVWEKASGVPLPLAVASSCALPFIFPPVTINSRRYIDGGIGSPTNADIAVGFDLVIIVNPLGGLMVNMSHVFNAEVVLLQNAGSRVETLLPGESSSAAIGFNPMDPARCAPAAQAGYQQGAAAAEALQSAFQ